MKLWVRVLIFVGVTMLPILFIVDQLPAKRKYDELRDEFYSDSNIRTQKMAARDKERLKELQNKWTLVQSGSMAPGVRELLAHLEFQPNVAGLMDAYSYEVPPYSFVDSKRNQRNTKILAFLNLSAPPPHSELLVSNGMAFIEYKKIAELYRDTDEGITFTVYYNSEKIEPGADQPATASEPKSEGEAKPKPESEERSR